MTPVHCKSYTITMQQYCHIDLPALNTSATSIEFAIGTILSWNEEVVTRRDLEMRMARLVRFWYLVVSSKYTQQKPVQYVT